MDQLKSGVGPQGADVLVGECTTFFSFGVQVSRAVFVTVHENDLQIARTRGCETFGMLDQFKVI